MSFAQAPGAEAVRSPARATNALREAPWLHARRARVWLWMLAAFSLMAVVAVVGSSQSGLDGLGRPLGTDFLCFWSAARVGLTHPAADVWQMPVMVEALQSAFPGAATDDYFAYPPTTLLLILPLGLMPYLAALAAWLALGAGLLAACLRRLAAERSLRLAVWVFPAWLVNAGHGQNGFFTAAAVGGAMLLERRPWLAGMCLGTLVCKPHLGVLVPVLLLAARRWRVLGGACLSGGGLMVASWAVLGEDSWLGFLESIQLSRVVLEDGMMGPGRMVSVFAAVQVLGGSLDMAYWGQLAATLGVATLLAFAVARRPGAMAEGALLATATPLATPYVFDYDLTWLALPLLWCAGQALRGAWRPWEKIGLLAAYVLPLFARPLAMSLGLPVAPAVLFGLLLLVRGRAATMPETRCGASPAGP